MFLIHIGAVSHHIGVVAEYIGAVANYIRAILNRIGATAFHTGAVLHHIGAVLLHTGAFFDVNLSSKNRCKDMHFFYSGKKKIIFFIFFDFFSVQMHKNSQNITGCLFALH